MWQSKNNLWESFLFSHHMRTGGQILRFWALATNTVPYSALSLWFYTLYSSSKKRSREWVWYFKAFLKIVLFLFYVHLYFAMRVGSPEITVTDSCELLYVCWESNQGSLEDQLVLLTTEPTLWPLEILYLGINLRS